MVRISRRVRRETVTARRSFGMWRVYSQGGVESMGSLSGMSELRSEKGDVGRWHRRSIRA
ncbi:hypothetical protein SHIRM173S_10738 [Streptomyces hirsutus]